MPTVDHAACAPHGATHIIIFAKAPVPGFAKTRLIPALGAVGAAALAQRMLQAAVAAAAAARLGTVELCVAPNSDHEVFQQMGLQQGLTLTVQGEGDLGQRMHRALQRGLHQHPQVLLMGTDAPALDAECLRAAATLLHSHDAVFVPALDGGYALVGLQQPQPGLFEAMAWSTPQVLHHTRQRARAAGLRWAETAPVADIDEPADLQHLPAGWLNAPMPSAIAEAHPNPAADAAADADADADAGPGRSCPLHYRYPPMVFAGAAKPDFQNLDVLYVVGGLYGNELALNEVLALFDAEKGRKRLVFNGDFHWFDAEAAAFSRVQQRVLAHTALRGNVETELAPAPSAANHPQDDAGCGCAYPGWVGQDVVARSNRILQRLRQVPTPQQRGELARLPMWLRADVGPLRVGVVHGDAQSLAGWGFAQEHLRSAAHRAEVLRWFAAAQVHAFASSHTCLPVFQALAAHGAEPRWVYNNGAAGMPNFSGDSAGLCTRIARTPFDGPQRRFGVQQQGVFIDGLALAFDPVAWQQRFLHLWPAGSDAHASYFSRICAGPDYKVAEAVRSNG